MSRATRARSLKEVPAEPIAKKRRRPPFWVIVTSSITVFVAIMATLIVVFITVWSPAGYADAMRAMNRQVGIVNGKAFPLVIANSINSEQSVDGVVILFAGSLTSKTQDTMRIGYEAPNGDSYILSVPVESIIFHQEVGGSSSGEFFFKQWIPTYNLQDNIDAAFGDSFNSADSSHITVNLTPEEFRTLVQG